MARKNIDLKKKLTLVGGIVAAVLVIWGIVSLFGGRSSDLSEISATSITEQGQPHFAVINMYKITAEADALKGLTDQRKAYAEKLNAEATRREEQLMATKKEIESKQSVLSKEALQKKAGEYQKSLMDYQNDMSSKSSAIEKSYRETLQKVQADTLDEVISDIAKKKGVTIVLNSAQTILLNPALDITEDVIKVMNKRLPSVRMKTPEGF
ncbi:MAG: OmpH family outer membrane protein [Alphaproteobacteria bacterium]|nr:OmpH family outer membrane protein [Alphaproteobacteria bacterium]MBN2779887.1 OmpH family outer membrane protein [Alphaproteobacteria bacterium]